MFGYIMKRLQSLWGMFPEGSHWLYYKTLPGKLRNSSRDNIKLRKHLHLFWEPFETTTFWEQYLLPKIVHLLRNFPRQIIREHSLKLSENVPRMFPKLKIVGEKKLFVLCLFNLWCNMRLEHYNTFPEGVLHLKKGPAL